MPATARRGRFSPRYLAALAEGGSDWPEKILAPLGVDLTDPGFWKLGLGEVEAMVARAEDLVRQTQGA